MIELHVMIWFDKHLFTSLALAAENNDDKLEYKIFHGAHRL